MRLCGKSVVRNPSSGLPLPKSSFSPLQVIVLPPENGHFSLQNGHSWAECGVELRHLAISGFFLPAWWKLFEWSRARMIVARRRTSGVPSRRRGGMRFCPKSVDEKQGDIRKNERRFCACSPVFPRISCVKEGESIILRPQIFLKKIKTSPLSR